MSTHVTGFQSFLLGFLHHFVLAKLDTTSLTVKSDLAKVFHVFLLVCVSYS